MTDLTTDQKIENMLKKVAAQRAEVEALERDTKRPWETNCSFKLEGAYSAVNLQVANVTQVHNLMTDLVLRRNASAEAAKILGIEVPEPTVSGFTYGQWEADLKKRVAIITLNEKKKKLDDQESRLNKLVSPEKRRAMELAALEAELG